MFKVEQYQHIRELYTVKGYSQRQIAKILGISRNTVRKYCQGACLPFEKSSRKRQPSVMTPKIMNFIKECLKMDEEEGLPKQSHTAKRIYDRLVKELLLILYVIHETHCASPAILVKVPVLCFAGQHR